jgi:hypothetical protein
MEPCSPHTQRRHSHADQRRLCDGAAFLPGASSALKETLNPLGQDSIAMWGRESDDELHKILAVVQKGNRRGFRL